MQVCRLAAENLACRRGDRVLFRGLGLTLGAGAALQVTGANGTGKSSLIRILAGLLRPTVGTVTRMGAVGLVDERPALDPHQPLGHALGWWSQIDAAAANAGGSSFDRLGLADLLDVPVRYLSTGQKKRAAFARLVGQQAPIWLLDEPLNGLDRAGVALIEELAAAHCAEGGLCVVASHQPFTLEGLAQLDLTDFVP